MLRRRCRRGSACAGGWGRGGSLCALSALPSALLACGCSPGTRGFTRRGSVLGCCVFLGTGRRILFLHTLAVSVVADIPAAALEDKGCMGHDPRRRCATIRTRLLSVHVGQFDPFLKCMLTVRTSIFVDRHKTSLQTTAAYDSAARPSFYLVPLHRLVFLRLERHAELSTMASKPWYTLLSATLWPKFPAPQTAVWCLPARGGSESGKERCSTSFFPYSVTSSPGTATALGLGSFGSLFMQTLSQSIGTAMATTIQFFPAFNFFVRHDFLLQHVSLGLIPLPTRRSYTSHVCRHCLAGLTQNF